MTTSPPLLVTGDESVTSDDKSLVNPYKEKYVKSYRGVVITCHPPNGARHGPRLPLIRNLVSTDPFKPLCSSSTNEHLFGAPAPSSDPPNTPSENFTKFLSPCHLVTATGDRADRSGDEP